MAERNEDKRTAWIDVETDGLDSQKNNLLQVALIVTDGNLTPLHDGIEFVIHHSAEAVAEMRANCHSVVREMHDSSGLWDDLIESESSVSDVDALLYAELTRLIPERATARFGGNSITLDRNFLSVNLPKSYSHIGYRSYDLTSVAKLFTDNTPEFPIFEKKRAHTALEDIRESIAEARYYSNILRKLAGHDPLPE